LATERDSPALRVTAFFVEDFDFFLMVLFFFFVVAIR
jgi:hypothetical protein